MNEWVALKIVTIMKLLSSGGGDWAIRKLKIDSKKKHSVVLMGVLKSKSEYNEVKVQL